MCQPRETGCPWGLGVLASLLFFSRRHPALWGLRLEATCHRCSAGTTAESPACPSSTSAGTTGTQAEKKAFIFKVTTVTEATSSPGSPPPCWPSQTVAPCSNNAFVHPIRPSRWKERGWRLGVAARQPGKGREQEHALPLLHPLRRLHRAYPAIHNPRGSSLNACPINAHPPYT